jgi:MEMO1 family protein
MLTIALLVLALALSGQAAPIVRPPAVAGTFYPSDSLQLTQMVASHLSAANGEPEIDGDLIALIVPHAGLVYSGPVAAYSYRLLSGRRIKNVVICGPSHHVGFSGLSVYGPGVIWKTPLGQVATNTDFCNRLLKSDKMFAASLEPHQQEHCIEVQLPYLQSILSNFQLVPVVMGYQHPDAIDALTRALTQLPRDNSTLLIASSDWQHYRPASEGHEMDSLGMACLSQLDTDRLLRCFDDKSVEACGGGPIVAVVRAAIARGANRIKILRYGDSGDITGDKSSVVGYVAAVLYKANDSAKSSLQPTPPSHATAATPDSDSLSETDKRRLCEIARTSIETWLHTGKAPSLAPTPRLKQNGAAFVTLNENGELRGCIGMTQAVSPLYQTVSQCAISAAVSDPRFRPVSAEELSQIEIEISVLTPLQPVSNLNDIKVGRDGLMIRLGRNSGLLLPQVATEYHWDRTTFLEETCRKAGLPKDAYESPDATLYRFQALVFQERQYRSAPDKR